MGFDKDDISASSAACEAAAGCLEVVGSLEAMRSTFAGIDLSGFGAPKQANDIAASTVAGVATERGGAGIPI